MRRFQRRATSLGQAAVFNLLFKAAIAHCMRGTTGLLCLIAAGLLEAMSADIDDLAVERKTNRSPVRVLFVDDEEMVLRMLRAALTSMGKEWEASFVNSGPDALELLTQQSFDMVVSDMRMPGMTGAQLLNEVFKLYPATFR